MDDIPDCTYEPGAALPALWRYDGLSPHEVWRLTKRSLLRGYRRYIYRYRPLADVDRIRSIVVGGRLFLASPVSFNDPFDMACRVAFEGSPLDQRKELFNKLKQRQPGLNWKERRKKVDRLMANPDVLQSRAKEGYEQSRRTMGVSCFAGDPVNILMWSHYGAQHTGVCLQFDIAASVRCLSAAIPVRYTDQYPDYNFTNPSAEQLQCALLQKAKPWEYERESRIVCPGQAGTNYRFPPAACSAAIIGCRASAEAVKVLAALNEERTDLRIPPLRLYRAIQSPTRYRLCIAPLFLRGSGTRRA